MSVHRVLDRFENTEADRAGFEPAVEAVPLRRFSKPVPSATRPPVPGHAMIACSAPAVNYGQTGRLRQHRALKSSDIRHLRVLMCKNPFFCRAR